MYKHILIPVVFDPEHTPDAAIEVATQLKADGARISFLHVIEELPGYASSYVAIDFIERSRKEVQERISEIAGAVDGAEGVVVHGHSARTILGWAEDNAVDCITVWSHKPGLQDYFLGGTAARVVRYAQCAVHVIR